ncbi:pyridoxal-dependent decarboxylase, exosortase A system-associated [Rhodoferax sp.]|uniref:pyridoxal-dependent decarboxylase, exosortase A system-associated n=1 Tax=Rhodoferax sp. TaxID=50421 RepID=UPI002850CBDA|nr:pyridoxal-dependent decarboxylase, exosortase A system-associated [Rhodoferax sp.]MDR3368476.1 pyridoxal-dependent decarboxylase, exosortase A system-associated [Rhodoferax sp.]
MSDLPRPLPQHAPMTQFPVSHGELMVGDIRLSTLTARVGQTPFYAYGRSQLRQRVMELRQALPKKIRLHYAMKANPMPALIGFMVGLVDGIDVASAGELKVALDAGVSPQEISFAGPAKRDAELHQAVAAGVLVNIESFREVDVLAQASQLLGLPARAAVRINPNFELKGSGMKMGGGPKPFGVDVEQVPALLANMGRSGLQFEGFHLYPGSQNLNAEAICDALQQSFDLAVRLAEHAPDKVRVLNLGGGLGVPYFPGDQRLELRPIADQLERLLQLAQTQLPQATLVLEIGRYLVAEAGIYVTRVVDRKFSREQLYLMVDGGLHHHLAATGNFGQVLRKNYPVAIGNKMDAPASQVTSVVGPSCTPLDVLADRMLLPEAQVGDLVVVFQSGAYGASASPHQFLSHPSCLEVLV